uniref:Uncharacterized protein n=1 Tax=Accipiter nisus TaxID=211598 RepID=A0A8B9M1F1_9AVES
QEMAKLGTLRTQTAAPGARAEDALRSPAGRSRASAHRGGRPVTARVTSHGPGAGAAPPRREEGHRPRGSHRPEGNPHTHTDLRRRRRRPPPAGRPRRRSPTLDHVAVDGGAELLTGRPVPVLPVDDPHLLEEGGLAALARAQQQDLDEALHVRLLRSVRSCEGKDEAQAQQVAAAAPLPRRRCREADRRAAREGQPTVGGWGGGCRMKLAT